MKCKKIDKFISLLIDKEISSHQKQCLDEHLNDCQLCTNRLQEMLGIWENMDIPTAAVNAYLYTRIKSKINHCDQSPGAYKSPKWITACFAASIIIGGFLGYFTASLNDFNDIQENIMFSENGEWDPYVVYADNSVGQIYIDLTLDQNGEY